MKNKVFLLVCMWAIALVMYAQTDYTSSIKNPSFESGMTGWTYKSMGTQTNSVFTLKSGNTYVEKWTGRGGAVGSASVSQQLTSLPPGNYELSVAAQNIQEDTPTAAQKGARVFAGSAKTDVTIRNTYKVPFDFISGTVTIGFEAVDATGNWLALDNFRLTQVGTDLSAPLGEAIAAAETLYGDGSGKLAEQLKEAIDAAHGVASNTSATAEEQAAAIVALEEVCDKYRRANASTDQPLDLTSSIVNPSFEKGDFTGWTATGMALQSNSVFSIKNGTFYVERWTGRGGAVGDGQVEQVLQGMKPGRYHLKAVAQNIQEDTPTVPQSGACIFANGHQQAVTIRGDYTLDFVLVSEQLKIGFKAEGATGNWLAVDHFRLEYVGDNFDDVKAQFAELIAQAEQLVVQKMNEAARQSLQTAIDEARKLLPQKTTEGWGKAAAQLEAAYQTAATSQKVFAQLAAAIADAKNEIEASTATEKAAYQAAIDAAQQVYDSTESTDAIALAAIDALQKASFEFKIANGSGQGPEVTTDKRFLRGATWAFGRSTVKGGNILEQGFCWAEHPDPKVTDSRTTEYLNQEGRIYWLRDLKPATVYYIRAYAIDKNYAVGYGDVLKVVTVPKGTIGHWYNNGGDEATNDRINYAINTSMDYYWNNLSSIHGFGISVTYSPGTPTADCGYGGGMRVGASSSYQQPGTIMHEALHGIGVGTHGMWWSADMRSDGNRGTWLGDRVTEAVRFWDNSATAVITGDDMHLWPYGCNGAHEDTHSDNLYCMMGILAQALNEDGLPGSAEIGYALPYYSFNHEEGVKYYIKNEDAKRGLRSAYLVETSTHQLQWVTMSAEEAAADDAAAWYLTFTPSNQYYQLRNAASGYYMTYSGGIKTAMHTKPTAADNFHLMRGRVDVDGYRGYYIIHPESSSNPPALVANANGKTATAAWSIAKSATTQRWLILTGEEAMNFDNGDLDVALQELEKVLEQIRKLAQTPHTEAVEGADDKLAALLETIENQGKACTKGKEVEQLAEQARNAGMEFLSSVAASDINHPFDLTFMLENPDFDNDATTGWSSSNGAPGYDAKGAEFYERTFNFYQTLEQMPSGVYQLKANAFQRPGSADDIFAPYRTGNAEVTSSLYINNEAAAICHICDDRQPAALFDDGGWGSDRKMADGTYIPNCMVGAEKYFAKDLYRSSVTAEVTEPNSTLRVGLRCTKALTYYWTMFDSFRLFFFGQNRTLLGIDVVSADEPQRHDNVMYDLSGRKISSTHDLKHGIYIVNGKKVVK
ncbi:MAG: hypothetical protein J5529_10975 [Prevotella sp.]|nr:hypothetical protein [Prevotella sp.]